MAETKQTICPKTPEGQGTYPLEKGVPGAPHKAVKTRSRATPRVSGRMLNMSAEPEPAPLPE